MQKQSRSGPCKGPKYTTYPVSLRHGRRLYRGTEVVTGASSIIVAIHPSTEMGASMLSADEWWVHTGNQCTHLACLTPKKEEEEEEETNGLGGWRKRWWWPVVVGASSGQQQQAHVTSPLSRADEADACCGLSFGAGQMAGLSYHQPSTSPLSVLFRHEHSDRTPTARCRMISLVTATHGRVKSSICVNCRNSSSSLRAFCSLVL
ncbi:hypothetical protein BHE74_00056194 [Ensete ventricosum]|nr:hypothetical protein BHE74_00056194 [Ensete ventricosum]